MTHQHFDWRALRDRRMAEPGAAEAYEAARLAFGPDRPVRKPREATRVDSKHQRAVRCRELGRETT
jgi:hypothetical protein